jgi:hypothetical protein
MGSKFFQFLFDSFLISFQNKLLIVQIIGRTLYKNKLKCFYYYFNFQYYYNFFNIIFNIIILIFNIIIIFFLKSIFPILNFQLVFRILKY